MNRLRCKFKGLVSFFVIVAFLTGCNVFNESIIHDELFSYDVSYDVAYLKVMDAIEVDKNWTIAFTDMRKGIVKAKANEFSRDDVVEILIKSAGRDKATVELAVDSQRVFGVEGLLKSIDKAFIE